MIYVPREEVVIVGAARTPQGPLDGAVSRWGAVELGARAIAAALERAGIDGGEIDECVMGNVVSSGLMQAPAKQAAVAAGIPSNRPATTVNTVCASGMSAIYAACLSLGAGTAKVAVAGGMESRSNAPYLAGPWVEAGRRLPGRTRGAGFYLTRPRQGAGEEAYREIFDALHAAGLLDASVQDSLMCPFSRGLSMRNYAERCAEEAGIAVEEVNDAAAESYRRARAARDSGALDGEIAALETAGGGRVVADDIITEEREADLRALSYSHVTAYNAPALGDGAAAVVVALGETAVRMGWKPLARIRAVARVETGPEGFVRAPIEAVRLASEASGARAEIVEANESFGMQLPLFEREMGADIINPFGGAVAITHPVGASGARVVVTLVNAMRRLGRRHGAATICYGSGGAMAMAVEAV